MSHDQAKKELDRGTPAELICATCPWDRLCVEPPTMSAKDIEDWMKRAEREDEIAAAKNPAEQTPIRSLITIMTFAGRDYQGKLCPVFALRLRGPDGRAVADSIRTTMRSWGEPS